MTKKKIVHIHTDYKFTHNTKMFEGDYFSNISIVIQSKKPYPKKKENVLLFESNKKILKRIIEICSTADLVVLYDLTRIKVKLALSLPKKVKIAWRFFGYELYSKRPDLFKSHLSREYDVKKSNLVNSVKSQLSQTYNFLEYGKTYNALFNDSLKRIDYMFCLSQEEYQFISKLWIEIPKFIQLPHFATSGKKLIDQLDFDKKRDMPKPIIILGNNRSSYNNHLDIIKIIDRYQAKVNYDFTLLFNYGTRGTYANEVAKTIKNKSYYTLIDEFIPKNEFMEFYKKPTALVINGYRQMAGANIRMALENGTKIYLNDKNVHKKWLENEEFKIFSIEDFETDLKNDTLKLDLKAAKHNFENFKEFQKRYTKKDFQTRIVDELSG